MDPLSNLPKFPFHTSVPSAEKATVLADPNKTFTLVYWEIASVGSTAREMLAAYCPKSKWTHEAVNDEQWVSKQVPTPFSCLPFLKVTSAAGEEVILSEAMIVDQYLAEELDLLGDNKYESWTILAFNSSIHYLMERSFVAFAKKDHADRKTGRESFMAGALRKFIRDHEFHLQSNGNNGHYVGNRISLADIHLANAVHYFQTFPCGKMIEEVFRESEPIWKVVEKVLANPEIAAWRKTADFKQLERGSVEWYAQYAIPGENLPSCFKEE
ncbi:hypothetical protein BGZ93_011030 [Podila epicladia]|nr:hypothetical protein BGZ93_011030 [Podila epicladia]